MLKTILGRSCSILLKKTETVSVTAANPIRTWSNDEDRREKPINKSLEERAIRVSTADIFRSYVNYDHPYPRTCQNFPYLLPIMCDNFFTFPALTDTMESGDVVHWQKGEGDRVLPGDILAEIHTDVEGIKYFAAPFAGYLAKILVKAGEKNVPVGSLLCVIVKNKSDVTFYQNNLINIHTLFSRSTLLNFSEKIFNKTKSLNYINNILK